MTAAKDPHRTISFGIGCFNFGINSSAPKELKASQFVADVKKSLEAIHSINNISIEYDDAEDATMRLEGDLPTIDDDDIFFPYLHFFSLSFDLYIPKRVQREVTEHILPRSAETEQFKVYCQNEFDCPVTLVWPVAAIPDDSPSSSVVIVREYLRSEFKKLDGYITFEFMGPSPFHADFTLRPNPETTKSIFDSQTLMLRGYNEVNILYDTEEFDSNDAAFDSVRHFLGNELDVFYEIVRTERERSGAWLELQQVMEKIVTEEDSSLWARFIAFRARERLIHQAHQQLAEFETLSVFSQQRLAKLVGDLYKTKAPTFLNAAVEAEFEDIQDLPTGELGRLLAFVENRRSKSLEMAIVILAALLGGVAGSAITSLFS